jgi:uncharacterized tellurite resistance protein B-like protein
MTANDHDDHWREIPEAERVDYLIVVASVVGADREVSASELAPLEAMCRDARLADADRERVLAIARAHDAAQVDASLARMKGDIALRVSLMTDAIVIVFADGKVAPGESELLARLGHALDLHPGQIQLIARTVEASIADARDQHLSRELGLGVAKASPGVIRRLYDRFRGH